MAQYSVHTPSRIVHFIVQALFVISLVLTVNLYVLCQSSTSTDGATPAALQPGAPAGSYALSGFDNVNLYNGNLNFRLPLLSAASRGGAGSVVTLPIEQKWRVIDLALPQPNGSVNHLYTPIASLWKSLPLRYNPGTLEGRQAGYEVMTCPDSTTIFSQTLTRLTFTASDGTEFELRDDLTKGKPSFNGLCNNYLNPPSRGTVFITADGTSATFISDQTIYDQVISPGGGEFFPSGFLMLRDGTRYRIAGGKVDWMRDRNGNKITYGYDGNGRVITLTDSLNRVVNISYAAGGTTYDQISFNGFGGTPRTIRVNYASMSTVLHSGSPQTYRQLFPELLGASQSTIYNPTVISSVTLPNNQQYQFRYNVYGELARVILPTTGAFEYDYAAGVAGDYASGVTCCGLDGSLNVYRRMVERRVYPEGGSGSLYDSKTTYSRPESTTGNLSYVVVQHFKQGSSTPLAQQKHYFYGTPTSSFLNYPTDYSPWNDGREYQTESVTTDGVTVLKKEVTTFQQRTAVSWWPAANILTNNSLEPPNDLRVTQTVITIEPSGANLVTKQTAINPQTGVVGFDQFNNQTDVWEYDYGTSSPSTQPVRHVHTNYLTTNPANSIDYTGTSVHIRSLLKDQQIYSVNPSTGSETLVAQSETKYDETAMMPWYGSVQSWVDPGVARGNPTKVRRWLNPGNSWLETRGQFDQVGNVSKSWDAKNNDPVIPTTETSYSPTYHFAYATQTTSAKPDPTGQYGSATAFVTTSAYDFSTGLVTSTTDANGQTTNVAFNDALDRPTQVSRGVGTSAQNQTTFGYNDVSRVITTTSDLNAYNDNLLKSEAVYDGLGRTTEKRQYEGGTNYIVSQQQYDALGRVFKTSNSFRPWQSEIPIWTTTVFDALGRVLTVTTPDSAVVATAYSGNKVLVTDQMLKQRMSQSDALGRLTDVWEITAADAATESVSFPLHPEVTAGYRTKYAYDALDDLATVTQRMGTSGTTQTRTFVYNSLKRLTSATNPESGTLNYEYDNNGNLTRKTDARGIYIDYIYDALNRNTTANYSDTVGINPDIKRFYDGAIKGKGRFWYSYAGGDYSTGTMVEHTAIDSYDDLGRPLIQRQLSKLNGTWGPTYQTQRAYNRAGGVTTQTYPSGRTVSYAHDNAGRTNSFTGNLGDGINRTYSTGIIYSSLGGIAKEQFGTDTPLYNKSFYNSRGQLSEIRVGTYHATDPTWWNRGAIINHYSNGCWGACGGSNSTTSMTDNNGNLRKQEVYIPANEQISSYTTWWQGYDYDALNRLQRVHEYNGNDWQQEYVYDRYGNRTIHQANSWGTGINKKDFTVNAANNRLGVPGGQSGTMSYDNAGNLTTDTYTGAGSRTFDAENRMTQAWGGNNQQQFYTYNSDGQRVRRKINGVETWQIYGMDAELLAEYPASGLVTSPQTEYGYRNGQLLVTATGPNLALNKPASQSSTYAGSLPSINPTANLAVDGNTSGNYQGGLVATTNNEAQAWWKVDLGATAAVGSVEVWNRTDCCGDRLTNFNVILLDANQAVVASVNVPGQAGTPTTVQISGTARYVKVQLVGTNYLSLAEVKVLAASSVGLINWLVSDQLGTPRMVFDKTGSLANVKRHDYLPFGEELFAVQGLRTSGLGYAVDTVRQKFTSKERDIETGLDFFEARYYASTQGRFTFPDPLQASAKRRNPQTWNRYTYGLNNPLRYTDPDGEEPEDENPDVYTRTKIKTTEIVVQERGGGQIVREAKITVTESQTEYVGEMGVVLQTDPIQTSATAVDTGNGVLNFSQDQRDTMANVAQNIVEVSREKGFDATIALGIAQTETHMATLQSQETSAAKQTDVNPMQLSGGRAKAGDLRGNIAGAIDVFNSNSAAISSLNQKLQDYNRQAGRAAYANTAEGHINRIRGSVQTRTVSNQQPRLGFPTRPQ